MGQIGLLHKIKAKKMPQKDAKTKGNLEAKSVPKYKFTQLKTNVKLNTATGKTGSTWRNLDA
jgi:hypothetical protein